MVFISTSSPKIDALRQFLTSPAIARWNRIDPVVHHSLSTYNAFDNNPVFYSDPSGADSVDLRGRLSSSEGRYIGVEERRNRGVMGAGGMTPFDFTFNPSFANPLPEDNNGTGPGNGKKKSKVITGDLSDPIAEGQGTWTSEVTDRYAYSADFESWLEENNQDGFFPDDPTAAWYLYQSIYGADHTVFADGMDKARNAEKAMAHLMVWYTFFDISEEVFYVLPGSAFGTMARSSGRVFGFKGILPDRFTAFRNFGNNELAAFQTAGNKFSFGKNFQEKQFWLDQKGLNFWKNSSLAKPNTIKISLPQSHMRYYRLLDGHNALSYGPNDLRALNNVFRIIK